MKNYPNLVYLYWDEPQPPVSLTDKALEKDDIGSTPIQETMC
jgi:hypothetical protein